MIIKLIEKSTRGLPDAKLYVLYEQKMSTYVWPPRPFLMAAVNAVLLLSFIKPWSQVSSLSPRYVPSILSRKGSSAFPLCFSAFHAGHF